MKNTLISSFSFLFYEAGFQIKKKKLLDFVTVTSVQF